jgi:hypothetical protein
LAIKAKRYYCMYRRKKLLNIHFCNIPTRRNTSIGQSMHALELVIGIKGPIVFKLFSRWILNESSFFFRTKKTDSKVEKIQFYFYLKVFTVQVENTDAGLLLSRSRVRIPLNINKAKKILWNELCRWSLCPFGKWRYAKNV